MNAFKMSKFAMILPMALAGACAVTATPEDQAAVEPVVPETVAMVGLEFTPPSDDGGDVVEMPPAAEALEGGNSTLSLPDAEVETPVEPAVDVAVDAAAPEQPIAEAVQVPPPAMEKFYFTTDSSEISAEDLMHLSEHAAYLAVHPDATLVISGHADVRGSDTHNKELSQKRAEAIADALVQFGAPIGQLMIQAFGAEVPVVEASRWDENRRVELEYAAPTRLTQR